MMRTTPSTPAAADDLGKLLLRITLAFLLLVHGATKLIGGIGFITGLLQKIGIPAELGYLVFVAEIIAPLMLVMGIWTRAAALVVAINMVVAVLLVHTGQLLMLADTGGWALELQAMYFFAALVLALQGAGRYSIGGLEGRWN